MDTIDIIALLSEYIDLVDEINQIKRQQKLVNDRKRKVKFWLMEAGVDFDENDMPILNLKGGLNENISKKKEKDS